MTLSTRILHAVLITVIVAGPGAARDSGERGGPLPSGHLGALLAAEAWASDGETSAAPGSGGRNLSPRVAPLPADPAAPLLPRGRNARAG